MYRPKIEDCTCEITSYNLNGSKKKQKVVDLKKYSFNLERYCDQLEKALDKACEELHSNSAWCHYGKMSKKCGLSKEEWKKELMKDD